VSLLQRTIHFFNKPTLKRAGGWVAATQLTAILALLNMVLIIRAVGITGYGNIVLVQTYIFLCISLTNAASWHAVIKFTHFTAQPQLSTQVIGWCRMLDTRTSAVGIVLVLLGLWGIQQFDIWSSELLCAAAFYALLLPLQHLANTPVGILRALNRFDILSWHRTITAIFLTLAISYLVLVSADWQTLLLCYGIVRAIEFLSLICLGYYHLAQQNLPKSLPLTLPDAAQKKQWWMYIRTSASQNMLHNIVQFGDVFVISLFLGTQQVGAFKIIKNLASVIYSVQTPLKEFLYPLLTKTRKDAPEKLAALMRLLLVAHGLIALVLGVVLVVFASTILAIITNNAPNEEHQSMIVYLSGTLLSLALLPTHAYVLSSNYPQCIMRALGMSTALYGVSLAVLIPALQTLGAALAYPCYQLIYFCLLGYVGLKIINPRFICFAERNQ